MNAPQMAAICPTCKGSGVRTKTWVKWGSDRERERPQRCLACRGSGQVDPMRVCQTCGQWSDQCTCPKSKIIRLEAEDMRAHPGVEFTENRWEVTIFKDRKAHYLGRYTDEAVAIKVRQEAERLPVSEFPALKERYKQHRRPSGHLRPQPDEAVVEAEVPDVEPDVLHQKLVAAREADQRFQVIREQYCAAERDAVDAWNEYARELAASGQSDAFARSYLGFLREEINRP